ncbi:PAS domain S-box protein [Breoghania sp.]|uniref:PAS domain S-box protein n=1 Tax=Breoghania sp. TaxID=2065378 RepID=UPI002632B77B|nr:PAS domain S-box protein [Breoghania sp.]MDJ0931398.1 PAS domain S-box protein [Breoghania sp.]
MNPLSYFAQMLDTSNRTELMQSLPIERDDEIGDIAISFKRRTQARIDSEERAKVIIDSVLDGLILVGEDGTVEEFNPSCERMFGYRADDIIGNNIRRLLPDEIARDSDLFIEIYEKQHESGVAGSLRETEARTKQGNTLPVEIGIAALSLEGETKFSGIIRDISSRREIERMWGNSSPPSVTNCAPP